MRIQSWVGRIHERRAWQPTLAFMPGESHEQRSIVVCGPWGYKESNTIEETWHADRVGEMQALLTKDSQSVRTAFSSFSSLLSVCGSIEYKALGILQPRGLSKRIYLYIRAHRNFEKEFCIKCGQDENKWFVNCGDK